MGRSESSMKPKSPPRYQMRSLKSFAIRLWPSSLNRLGVNCKGKDPANRNVAPKITVQFIQVVNLI